MNGMRGLGLLIASLVVGLVLAAPSPPPPPRSDPDPRAIVDSMVEAVDALRDYTMVLVKQELRLKGLEPEEHLLTKWARPQRVYFKTLDGPAKGQEALYVAGWNRDRLRAHKGSFPDLTVNLDPRGSLAMAHTHHPASEASIVLLARQIAGATAEAGRRGEGSLRLVSREEKLGRPCFRLEVTSPPDGAVHVVAKGETLWDVASKHGSDMYVLLYRNRDRGYKGPADVRAGDSVFVPRYYAGKVDLWVDERTRLPLVVHIYAHDGALYERYEHRDLKPNVGLTDADFDPENPGYDF
jgi:LysM repeat protein